MMHRTRHIGSLVKRCFSAQAQAVQQDGQMTGFSKLPNGLKIATCNKNAPVARLVLLVNTGSRDDDFANRGLTHCLQVCAGLTSAKNTAFLTTQLLASLGADLEVTASRDHITYNINCYATAAKELIVDVLTPSILGAKFPWWEIRDMAVSRMRYQKAFCENDPLYLLMESAHKASFRGNFGNSVLSPDYMMGKHTSEMLSSRFHSAFTFDNMVLAGSGISHGALTEIGSLIEGIPSGSGSPLRHKPEFINTSTHIDRPDKLSYGALMFEGVAINDKDAIALSVLQQVMGTATSIKRGSGLANGLLNAAVEKETSSAFSTSTFSTNYSDTGLFGVTVVSPKDSIAEVMTAVNNECHKIATGGITDAALSAGKEKLKSRICMEAESGSPVANVAVQASTLSAVTSPSQICGLIDGLSRGNVSEAANRVLTGKKSLTTLGQNYDGPFLQDL